MHRYCLRQQCQLKLCYYRRRQDTDPRLQANCRESETKVKALVSMWVKHSQIWRQTILQSSQYQECQFLQNMSASRCERPGKGGGGADPLLENSHLWVNLSRSAQFQLIINNLILVIVIRSSKSRRGSRFFFPRGAANLFTII